MFEIKKDSCISLKALKIKRGRVGREGGDPLAELYSSICWFSNHHDFRGSVMIVFLMEFHSWLLLSMIFVGALEWYIPSNIKVTQKSHCKKIAVLSLFYFSLFSPDHSRSQKPSCYHYLTEVFDRTVPS